MEILPSHPNKSNDNSFTPHIPIVYEEEKHHWQYKHIRQNIDEEDPLDEDYLNELGQEDWELVSVFLQDKGIAHYYFKRLEDSST